MKYGKYVKVRVTKDVVLDEWTNVGIVFDENGKQIFAKMDFTRAKQRGDVGDNDEWFRYYENNYAKTFPDLTSVDRALRSTGHAMSCIQITEPQPTALRGESDWTDLFELLVLGKRHDRRSGGSEVPGEGCEGQQGCGCHH